MLIMSTSPGTFRLLRIMLTPVTLSCYLITSQRTVLQSSHILQPHSSSGLQKCFAETLWGMWDLAGCTPLVLLAQPYNKTFICSQVQCFSLVGLSVFQAHEFVIGDSKVDGLHGDTTYSRHTRLPSSEGSRTWFKVLLLSSQNSFFPSIFFYYFGPAT